MFTVTLEDIQLRIKMLEARRAYADTAVKASRYSSDAIFHTGDMHGLESGLKVLRELERFFADDILQDDTSKQASGSK